MQHSSASRRGACLEHGRGGELCGLEGRPHVRRVRPRFQRELEAAVRLKDRDRVRVRDKDRVRVRVRVGPTVTLPTPTPTPTPTPNLSDGCVQTSFHERALLAAPG